MQTLIGPVCVKLINNLSESEQINVSKGLKYKFDQVSKAEISAKVVNDVKIACGNKSAISYDVINAVSTFVEGKSTTFIKKHSK